MSYITLHEMLHSVATIKTDAVINETIVVQNLSFLRLRDILYESGKIILEDYCNHVFIVMIKGGFAKQNTAVTAFQLMDNLLMIAAYSQEGIINQHTSEGVINEFKSKISDFIQKN